MAIYADTLLLNKKYADYIKNTYKYQFNWAEGAFRSSKSVFNTLAFALYLENTRDLIHLVIASTVASARAIVEDGDGKLGLRQYFSERYTMGKYKGHDAGFVKTNNGIKTIVYLGGSKANSYTLFRGWSVGGIVLEELNLLHQTTIDEAQGRIFMAKDPKMFICHNPVEPHNPIYEWLNELQTKGLVNYIHTTLFDNPALTEERREEIINRYAKDSVFYKRYIDGLRCAAEGAIFAQYMNDNELYEDIDITANGFKDHKSNFIHYSIGLDLGNNEIKRGTVLTLTAISRGYKEVHVLESYVCKATEVNALVEEIVNKVANWYDTINDYSRFDSIWIDSYGAIQLMLETLRRKVQSERLNIRVQPAMKFGEDKGRRARLELIMFLINQKKIKFSKAADGCVGALREIVYDDKSALPLDNNTQEMDFYDSLCYSLTPYIRELTRN